MKLLRKLTPAHWLGRWHVRRHGAAPRIYRVTVPAPALPDGGARPLATHPTEVRLQVVRA